MGASTTEVQRANDSIAMRDSRTGEEDTANVRAGGYDPVFMNTASCQSAISYIDRDKGTLRYRG